MAYNLPDAEGLTVALDTEASGLFVDDGARCSVVSVAWRDGEAIRSLVFPFDQGDDTWLGRKTGLPKRYMGPSLFDVPAPNLELDAWRHLTDWLRRQRLVYHNSKYDQHIMRAGLRGIESETGAPLGRQYLWDTMVVAPLFWPLESVGLKRIAHRLWGIEETSAERDVQHWLDLYCGKRGDRRYDLVPWQLMEPYAAQDAALTLRLYEHQMGLLEEGIGDRACIDREIDFAQVLYRMEVRGIGFDVERARREAVRCATMVQQARSRVTEVTGVQMPTEDRMRVYWYNTLGHPPPSKTVDGTPQVTIAAVRQLVERGVNGAAEWQAYARLETAQSMWYRPWPELVGADGRLRTSYWQTKTEDDRRGGMRGTVSGRLAVERVQIQAIPHDYQIPPGLEPVRSFFQAKPGHILVECDMNQAEMRLAGGVTRCAALLEGFARGDDAHSITCKTTFKIDESAPEWSKYRAISKRLNFGLLYGAGLRTLVEQIVLFTGLRPDPEEVQLWLDTFKAEMPELAQGAWRATRQAEKQGYVSIPGGKRRYFRFGEPTHKAFNARIQGGVAACMADAQIQIEVQHPGHQLAQIHDSIILEVPHNDVGREIVRNCQQLMVAAFEKHVDAPFKADAKVFQ